MNPTSILMASTSAVSIFGVITSKIYDSTIDMSFKSDTTLREPQNIVSIVLPAFNEEEYIENTLISLLSQNIILRYPQYFECIVVDNESTDRTAEIARQYCQVISAPRGKLNARDTGIRYAAGDIIVACDADCYYPPNYINLLISHFRNPNVVAVQGVMLITANVFQKLGSIWLAQISNKVNKRLYGAVSAFRKEIYLDIGGFDLSTNQLNLETIMAEEEVAFFLKLQSKGKVVFDNRACCFHIQRGAHGTVAQDLRLTDKRALEVIGGERF